MIKALRVIILFHICLISLNIQAGEVITNSRLDGTALTAAGANLKVSYDKFSNLPYSSINPLALINTSQGMLEFGVDETKKVFHSTNFTSIVTITYFTKDFNLVASAPQVQTLEINYFPNKSYTGQSVFKIPNVSYIEITNISIQSYKDYGVPGSQVSISSPSDLYLESSIKVDETLSFDFSTALPMSSNIGYNIISTPATPSPILTDIEAYWNYLPGAEEYELEYIYIDDYDATSYLSSKAPASITYDFEHDATRIITHNQYYRIPLVYEKGYIVFRVRGIGRSQTNNNVRLEGTWSNAGYVSGTLLSFNTAFLNQSYHILKAHEDDQINWASTRTFAENGKSGVGISYEDGLLKNRQSVAKLNTEDKTIVQASLYDWHGRPAISVLPTPFNDNYLSYKKDLNKTSLGAQFDKNIFDNIASYSTMGACNPQGLIMDPANSTGAAKYYSSLNNTGQDAQQALVPDAHGMPYVQVDYYPDQTGRIKRQSMPGSTHFLGSEKEHKFFYSQPTQTELVRLFGTEVGVYDEYEKQIDIDPNGQKTVTYTDGEGRTVATALMGAAPSNLIALADATNPLTAQTDITTLVNNNNDASNYILGLTNNFYASKNEIQEITYDVTASQYTDVCLPNMCLDCIYELEISLKDDCGQELLDGDLATAGFQPITAILGRYTPGATPEFAKTCSNTTPTSLHFGLSPSPFTFVVPKDGTYHLSKTLKLSTKPLIEYADAFVKNNTCIQTLTSFQNQNLANIDISGCGMLDCAQCSTAVNTYINSLPVNTLTQSQKDDLLAKCNLTCGQTQDICQMREKFLLKDFKPGGYFGKYDATKINFLPTPDNAIGAGHSYSVSIFNPLNSIESLVLGTPNSGKWFTTPPPPSYGSYTTYNPTGGTMVAPNLLNSVDFISTFNDSYAKPWLKFHPEYCRLQFNCDGLVNAINDYTKVLQGINSFDDACRLGYLYPLPSSASLPNAPNASSCSSCVGSGNHYNPLYNYSGTSYLNNAAINAALANLTSIITSHTFLDMYNNPQTMSLYQMAIGAGENVFPTPSSSIFGSGCNKDKEWLMYKNIYLSYVTNLVSSLQIDYINNWTINGNTGGCLTVFSGLPNYVRIFPEPTLTTTGSLSGYGNGSTSISSTSSAGSSAAITTQCASYCHGYINSWISNLTACSINSTDMPNVTAALEKVCTAGCDLSDPFGASNATVPGTFPVTINLTNGSTASVTDFQGVLNAFGYNFSASCNAYLIDAPKPKGYSYSGSATTTTTLDACGCDAILNAHSSYTAGIANSTINACLQSEADYFSQQLHVALPYLSAYVCACTKAKNSIGTGYDFSLITDPSYNLGMPLPLPKELACKHCINCNDVAKIREQLSNAFPGIAFSSINHVALNNFLNGQFNMNNTYDEWVTFINDCNFNRPANYSGNPFYAGNTSQQTLDLKGLFQSMYSNNFFVPNTALTPYILTPGNSPAFFNSSLWNSANLLPGTTPSAQLLVTNSSGGFFNITISSSAVSPAYNLSINIGNFPSGSLNSPISHLTFSDIYAFCESGLSNQPYGRKQFICLINYTDPTTSLPTPAYLHGGNTGTNSFSTFSPINNLPPTINNSSCSAYLCTHSLESDPPPPNNCLTIVVNNALNAAQTQYNTYIAAQVSQFLANYKNYCYNHVTEHTTRKYLINEYHHTLYYYDRSGNLVHTVPPAGVTVITNPIDIANAITYVNNIGFGYPPVYPHHSLNSTGTSGNITSYISHNQYNTFDAPTTQVTPDGGETNFYYDHIGRLAVSQNSKQVADNTYSYSLYDDLGRITEVGVFGFSTAIGDVFTPDILKNPATWQTFINSHPRREVTRTYYDKFLNTTTNAQFPNGQQNLRNRVSATTHVAGVLGYPVNPDIYDYASFFSYDDHGHVSHIIQHNPTLHSYNAANEFKHIEYEYELISGNVNKVIYQRSQLDQWFHKYEYDADNRLHTVYTSDNDLVYQRDAKYFYYQHGPMARTEIGEKQVQGTDYAFTIQGWVKGVNSNILNETNDIGKDGASGNAYMSAFTDLHKDFAKDASSYSLNYFNNDYNPIKLAAQNFLADMTNLSVGGATGFKLSADAPDLYNGNISSMVTSIYDVNPVSVDKGKAKPQITGYQYDQLHRLKHMKAYSSMQILTGAHHSEAIDLASNQWIMPDATQNYSGVYEMDLNYDKMGNIQSLTRKGDAQYTISWQAKQMDNLTYNYSSAPITISSLGKQYTINNRLTQVVDNSSPSADANYVGLDIDGTHNYDYNNIGSLQSDVTEEIQTIEWTDAHKVKSVIRTSTSSKSDIYFGYDPFGRRISKTVIGKSPPGVQDPSQIKTTHYVLDAEGNNMGIYEEIATNSSIKCVVRTIFGSDRLGVNNQEVVMFSNTPLPTTNAIVFGKKDYETHNHLGNVITTISDRKIQENGIDGTVVGVVDYYTADIVTTTDYYAFGQSMPGRTQASNIGGYKYAHNGQEKDNEIFDGALSAEFWEYDARLGRRWENDPIVKPWESPYATFANNPIWNNDVKGLDAKGGPGKGGKRFHTNKRQFKKGRLKDHRVNPKTDGKGKGKDKGNPEKKQPDKKPTEKQKDKKQGPTIYVYRVKTASDKNYKFENDKDLSDNHLKNKIAPEIARIMNNNWLNTPIYVKVITEEEAKLITSDFLIANKSAIMPIVNGRALGAPGASLGQSAITKGGGVTSVNPDETYANYPGIKNHFTKLGVTTSYGLAWTIAHEALHQLYSMSQTNFNPYADHTNGWPNLNRDGQEVNSQDFKSISPFDNLKNMAEWIPMKIKQSINNWFQPSPIKP